MDINYYKKYEPIDGKWYITKKLGSGAFGTVLEVERRDQTNMKAAMKIISVPSTPDEADSYRAENYDLDEQSISSYFYGFVEEFTKEIQLMSELRGHGNVVTIEDYDVKKHTDSIGWDIFIRMELLTPMNAHFAKNSPKTRDVIKLGIDICKALEVCQKFKITHRDIKPSNIFISKNGDYKLGDFGVARTLEKTVSGSQKGTYTYMAPEIHKGELYNSNVDIYSLGIVMYKLLNNNMEPYKHGRTHLDEQNALDARLKGEPMPKPANAEGRLAEIILKACSFNPKDRYESPLQMRSELESILLNEDEEKLIHPDGEDLKFEPSDIPSGDGSKTPGILDNTLDDADDGKTVSIFGQVEEEKDKTVGLFDNRNVVSNAQTSTNTTTSTTPVSSKKEETPSKPFSKIDDFDDELKKMNEAVRRPTPPPPPKAKPSLVHIDSGGAFKKMDALDEELKKLQENKTYKKKSRTPWIFIVLSLITVMFGAFLFSLVFVICACIQYYVTTEKIYREASQKLDYGNPLIAYDMFYSLGNYKNSFLLARTAEAKIRKQKK